MRNSFDVIDRNISFPSLNPAEIASIHLDVISEVLLANAPLCAVMTNVRRQNLA